ncbi:uncharacterized protein METZ01_LOCUS458050 [marine metagenome]|uniref:Uncharacterized protein n=1 Tax=marine metagenome TaxID=408172 RepID=A0A383ABF7_9ZZZZ
MSSRAVLVYCLYRGNTKISGVISAFGLKDRLQSSHSVFLNQCWLWRHAFSHYPLLSPALPMLILRSLVFSSNSVNYQLS